MTTKTLFLIIDIRQQIFLPIGILVLKRSNICIDTAWLLQKRLKKSKKAYYLLSLPCLIAACAAASLAMGTLNGEQET